MIRRLLEGLDGEAAARARRRISDAEKHELVVCSELYRHGLPRELHRLVLGFVGPSLHEQLALAVGKWNRPFYGGEPRYIVHLRFMISFGQRQFSTGFVVHSFGMFDQHVHIAFRKDVLKIHFIKTFLVD
jgi:hypothetical protein